MPLLDVKDLYVHYKVKQGWVYACDGVTTHLERGETLGLVGESACGKTTLGYSISQLLPNNAFVRHGHVFFQEPEDVRVYREKLEAWAERKIRSQAMKAEASGAMDRARAVQKLLDGQRDRLEKDLAALEGATGPEADRKRAALSSQLAGLTHAYDLVARSMSIDGRLREYGPAIRSIRWKEISMVFQGAMNAFNPVYTVGAQIIEAIQQHADMDDEEAEARVKELFQLVGVPADRIYNYPHEYSGGMRQRAMIAMALALNPSLVIADEPTTALDVITQHRILDQIREIQKRLSMSMMIITHDISVVAKTARRINVMYAGRMAEQGTTKQVFQETAHPYTAGLLASFPAVTGAKRRLASIPGNPPSLVSPPTGCRFHPRCPYAKDICRRIDPPPIRVGDGHVSHCHFAEELAGGLRWVV